MARLDDYAFRHDGVIYTFSIEAQESPYESKVQGRKVFKDVEILNALIPSAGAPKQSNSDLVTPDLLWRKGIEAEYEKWKAGARPDSGGTPVSTFEMLSKGQIKTLEASNIFTLEQFIDTAGDILSKMVGPEWRNMVEKAKQITGHSADPGVRAVREENVKMKDEMEILRQQIAALTESRAEKPKRQKREEATSDEAAA